MFIYRNRFLPFNPVLFYETPDVTSSAAPQGSVDGGTGAPTGAPQGQPQQSTGLDWGMFPNVPEEHRPLLEPTIREQIQPYITRLEQQYAPFKPFEGISPEDATGLLQMSQAFEQDPVGVWLRMGQALQQQQHLSEIDMEMLQQLATGQYQEEPEQQQLGDVPPELAQYLQPLMQQVDGLTQWQQQALQQQQEQQRQEMERRQAAAYQNHANYIKEQAKAAGYPEQLLTDEAVRAAIVVAGGDREAAVKFFVDQRSGLLQGFVQQNTVNNGQRQRTRPNGAPPSRPERKKLGGNSNPGFDGARAGAEQFLRRQNAANAQG